ncbi:MAG: aminotransferase class I/II-fold pyridoxal phosphate-dependent enzyme [Ktedonobacteraceae bacterium]|nr:aminotransferase class I/II-fold pyridoxal phosphate-dependent enzyme [Ktedonobacteraceae bacterium]
MPTIASRVKPALFSTSIFTEMNTLAQQYNAVNLGQGKPDADTPSDIIQRLIQVSQAGRYNQYAPAPGTPALRQAVSDHAARFYNLDIDPLRGVVVTSGATEGICASIMGLVDPGDEVIIIEPFYDAYLPNILMAQAIPVYVPLHPPTWTFDPAELRAAFSQKTRVLILNSPHNPTGRVFTHEELTLIAQLCIEYDVTVIADEVYEHLVYAPSQHVPIATLPGMFERTVTISSSGKLFNTTGWKIGWVSGPPDLIDGTYRAHQFITFAVHHLSQETIAYALHLPDTYYTSFQAGYAEKRNLILSLLAESGLKALAPQGTYFVLADFSDIFTGTSREFAHYLVKEIGVASIPPDSLYSEPHAHLGQNYVRFSFCKSDESLLQAKERLAKLKK